jgi:hypothetical protein
MDSVVSGFMREFDGNIRGRLFFDEIYGEFYFFVPDEPVYMGCFDDYLAILYILPEDARYIFSESELMEVAVEGFSVVSLSEGLIYELSV